jgi:hypothetical protein
MVSVDLVWCWDAKHVSFLTIFTPSLAYHVFPHLILSKANVFVQMENISLAMLAVVIALIKLLVTSVDNVLWITVNLVREKLVMPVLILYTLR